MRNFGDFIQQMTEVLSGADAADGSGKYVIEYQSGNGKTGHERAHGVPHHYIDAAAHEHAAAFHVNGTDCKAEQHDPENEPRRALANSLLDDPARIKGGGGQIAEDNGRAAPE